VTGVRLPAGAENLSPGHHVQTGSGAHPASYPMSTGGSLPGDKAAGAWCRGQECVELYLYTPNTPSWRGAQLKHKDNFIFTFTD